MKPRLPRISRRTTLAWLAGMAAAGTVAGAVLRHVQRSVDSIVSYAPTAGGYGTDPDLSDPHIPWPRLMTAPQRTIAAALADLILPGSATAPPPSAIGIADFIDEWISAPYPAQQNDRKIITDAIARLDGEANRRWGQGFVDLEEERCREILARTTPSAGAPLLGDGGEFFRRLRYLVVTVYYSTAQGLADIGYLGNTALAAYPAPNEAEKIILEEELRKLGL